MTKRYINNLIRLSKTDFRSPFKAEWVDQYAYTPSVFYLENTYHLKGTTFQEESVIGMGEKLKQLLEELLPTITHYPYDSSLTEEKLDPLGYDFSLEENQLEIEPVAYLNARKFLKLPDTPLGTTVPYTEPEMVTGGHLTKFSLLLEKASPLSQFSIRLHSAMPVRLASLVYEGDTAGYQEPVKVLLDNLQVQQSNESITILFGEAIFAKRLTFVLAQDHASSNHYYEYKESTDQRITQKDWELFQEQVGRSYLESVSSNTNVSSDWSQERKDAYQKERTHY